MQVYKKICHYIENQHLELDLVARLSCIPDSKLEAMLRGEKKMYVDDLVIICQTLGVSADTFIETGNSVTAY